MNKYLEQIKALNKPSATPRSTGICSLRISAFFEQMKELLFYSWIHTNLNEERMNSLLHEAETNFNAALKDYKDCPYSFDNLVEFLPKLKDMLLLDIDAIYEGDPACESKEEVVLTYPGFFAIAAYRFAHELYLNGLKYPARALAEYAHSKTGIDINPGAKIGKSFFIDHGTGIVIGETCEIGDNVKLYQGVTLGALSLRKGRLLKNEKRHPTIEDRVTIYSGASIFGGQTIIGHDSTIGSNAFITESVPPNSLVRVKPYDLEIAKH